MKNCIEKFNEDLVIKFLKETKDGFYVEIDKNLIETPRTVFSRDEFVFDEEMPLLYSLSTQI